MIDGNSITALESAVQQIRNAQAQLTLRLQEIGAEADALRAEIASLEATAVQMERRIDAQMIGNPSASVSRLAIDEYEIVKPTPVEQFPVDISGNVTYFNQHRRVPTRTENMQPVSQRFADRTITQACTLLLRESGRPLHVNELYNLLTAGGMQFSGKNPTISIAVSLSRNGRFEKVDPGTFQLATREVGRMVS
ncbi:MAG: winged helix-turn-helix domain-containing protein [Blastocatellia bacterium]|nr:winged helix-turn-helix domain-containing protein [Blastocatellia bacterium]